MYIQKYILSSNKTLMKQPGRYKLVWKGSNYKKDHKEGLPQRAK